jgi:cell division septation protein DedD
MSQSGEKELILGNKQLISLFFIVVALCGVFFAMGYMVRGNSVKGSVSTTGDNGASASDGAVKRQQPEPPRETGDAPASGSTAPPDASHVETHPAEDAPPASATVPASTAASAATPAPVDAKPAPAAEVKPAPDADAKSAAKPEALEAGATYVQVRALPLADAQAMVRTLREQHLPAGIAPSSKENLFRVLVGPYHQTADVADAKARLKTLGFSNAFVQKQ